MKFSIKDFFSKCDQIRSFLQIWLHLLKKSLIENFIVCAMVIAENHWFLYKSSNNSFSSNNSLSKSEFIRIHNISHFDQVNSWKNLWEFWNGQLCRNKSAPSPYSMLQDIGRVATPKLVSRNCFRYLQTTLIMG